MEREIEIEIGTYRDRRRQSRKCRRREVETERRLKLKREEKQRQRDESVGAETTSHIDCKVKSMCRIFISYSADGYFPNMSVSHDTKDFPHNFYT